MTQPEGNMPRFLCFALATLLVVGLAHPNGQTSGKSDSNLPTFTGIVKAVAATSLLVQRGDSAMLFVVDQKTRVFAKKQPDGKDLVWRQRLFTDFVKVGDQVAVKYRHADEGVKAVDVLVVRSDR
jgi:hypothetical protein